MDKYPEAGNRLVWWELLGENSKLQNDWVEATQVYWKAVEEYPQESSLWIELGYAKYYSDYGLDEAIQTFQQAIKLDEDQGLAFYAIADVYIMEQRFTEADHWYQEADRTRAS